jgi:glyoxylase-like metal-dependent hydrolase (beta-lactamase superfamily II)
MTDAELYGPAGEREDFPLQCQHWLADGDEPLPGMKVFALDGSKTPGELALLIEDKTLITGDLIRAHEGGRLCLLPDHKLTDKAAAILSVKRIARTCQPSAILTGDGWPVFRDGQTILAELVATLGV